jgi:hypothetical protein
MDSVMKPSSGMLSIFAVVMVPVFETVRRHIGAPAGILPPIVNLSEESIDEADIALQPLLGKFKFPDIHANLKRPLIS